MKYYRVMYMVQMEDGSIIPHYNDFLTKWRARLEIWLLRRRNDVLPTIETRYYDE